MLHQTVVRRAISSRSAFLGVFCMSFLAFPQDANTLKQRFATFLKTSTTGTYAKIAWLKKGANMGKPFCTVADIQVMDTKDGIIRTLVPRSATGSTYSGVTISWDGNWVIYGNQTDLTIHRVSWDGAKDTVILRNFEGDGHCWRSPDGKQWVMATEYKGDGVTGARLYRVNMLNPAEKVLLLTCATWSRVSWLGATSWASMSVDGKYVTGGFPNYGQLGWFKVDTTTPPSSVTSLSPNGCFPTMSRDNNYQILHTDDGGLSHKELYIQDITGKKILARPLGTDIIANANYGFETLRGTSDPAYCAFWSGWYVNGNCDGTTGGANPKILRISDLAWVGIHDSCTTPEGNCDVWFYAGPTVIAEPGPRAALGAPGRDSDFRKVFDCRGRRLDAGRPGIRIRVVNGTRSSRVIGIKPPM